MGREGLEGPPGTDGLPGTDGSKGVKVKSLSVLFVRQSNRRTAVLIVRLLCLGGAGGRWRRGFTWKIWAAG